MEAHRLHVDEGVRGAGVDGLEALDRTLELHPGRRVARGHAQHAVRDPGLDRAGRGGGAVGQPLPISVAWVEPAEAVLASDRAVESVSWTALAAGGAWSSSRTPSPRGSTRKTLKPARAARRHQHPGRGGGHRHAGLHAVAQEPPPPASEAVTSSSRARRSRLSSAAELRITSPHHARAASAAAAPRCRTPRSAARPSRAWRAPASAPPRGRPPRAADSW